MSDKQEFEKYGVLAAMIEDIAANGCVGVSNWSQFIGEINKALKAASQPPAVKGAWVKANIEYPKESGWYLSRTLPITIPDFNIPLRFSANVICDMAGKTYERYEVEWLRLDESPTAAGDGKEEKAFAESPSTTSKEVDNG